MKKLSIVLTAFLFFLLLPPFPCLADQAETDTSLLMKYQQGDVVSILVEVPLDVESVVAVMPNGDNIKLTNDANARAWHGAWRVPQDLAPGVFRAKVLAVDYEGMAITSSSEPFVIETSLQNNTYEKGGELSAKAIKAVVAREATAEAPSEISSESVWYKVRVGLFSDKKSATLLMFELRAQGYDAFEVLQLDLWSVQVGAFRDRDNAFNLYTEFRQKGYFADILVTDL